MAREFDHDFTPPNTGAEKVPPGATRAAFDREEMPDGGPPGSGGGSRHAADDDDQWNTGLVADPADDRDATAYGGSSGGAVGGTPANMRASGGRTGGGISPGADHRGDSTIGTDPDAGTD